MILVNQLQSIYGCNTNVAIICVNSIENYCRIDAGTSATTVLLLKDLYSGLAQNILVANSVYGFVDLK